MHRERSGAWAHGAALVFFAACGGSVVFDDSPSLEPDIEVDANGYTDPEAACVSIEELRESTSCTRKPHFSDFRCVERVAMSNERGCTQLTIDFELCYYAKCSMEAQACDPLGDAMVACLNAVNEGDGVP